MLFNGYMIYRLAFTFIGAFFLSLLLSLSSHVVFSWGDASVYQIASDLIRTQAFWIALAVWTFLFFLLFTLPFTYLFSRNRKVS
jgi:hypothetical protein